MPVAEDYLSWQRDMYDMPELRAFPLRSGLTDTPTVGHVWAGAGLTRSAGTIIGFFCVAPNGTPLACVNDQADRGCEKAMLERALEKYSKMTREERLLSTAPKAVPTGHWRWKNAIARKDVPSSVLVLRGFMRDTDSAPSCGATCKLYQEPPRGKYVEGVFKDNWNMDYAWLQDPEVFVPKDLQPGKSHPLPGWVARTLAKYHFIDSVHGRGALFTDAHVKKADLSVRVKAVEGDVVSLVLEGATRTEAKGVWQPSEVAEPSYQERGVDVQIFGWIRYDRSRRRFEQFDLVASGTRWGTTESNRRFDVEFPPFTENRAPAPIGFAFRLRGSEPNDGLPPVMMWKVGAKYFSKS